MESLKSSGRRITAGITLHLMGNVGRQAGQSAEALVHVQEAVTIFKEIGSRYLPEVMEGRTSFVIAHHLSTIRNADQVSVINNGCLIERGTHTGLLHQRGLYDNLYMSQFKGTKHSRTDLEEPSTPSA